MSENAHPKADELDDMSALEFVNVMHAEDRAAVQAVGSQLPEIASAVEMITARLRELGRMHYFGAGTSGMVAAMDAAEIPATFGVGEDVVQAHVVRDIREDDRGLGHSAATAAGIGPRDVAVGISASGRTAYVLGALEEATARGALTVAIISNPLSRMGRGVDITIQVETGPEVIAGSTRLKAGTVQKLVLNMLSTAVFTRLGRTYRGRMVGVVASNEKLRARAAKIVSELTGVSIEEARARLVEANGDVRAVLAGVRRT